MATTPAAAFILLPLAKTHHRLSLSSPFGLRSLSHNHRSPMINATGGGGSNGGGSNGGGSNGGGSNGGGSNGGGGDGGGGKNKDGYWVWVPGRDPDPVITLTTGDVTFRFKDHDSYNRYMDDYMREGFGAMASITVFAWVIGFLGRVVDLRKAEGKKEEPNIESNE